MVAINAQLDLSDQEALDFLDGIQGNILKGHARDHAAHLFVRLQFAQGACRNWIRDFGRDYLTSAKNESGQIQAFKTQADGGIFENLALSVSGYAALGLTEVPVDTRFRSGIRNSQDLWVRAVAAAFAVRRWSLGVTRMYVRARRNPLCS